MIRPTHDNLLVEIETQKEKEKKTESGIILTASKNQPVEKESTGIVVAVGTGRYLASGHLISPCAKIGEKVIFNKFAGTEIVDGERTFLLIKENDVLGIIE